MPAKPTNRPTYKVACTCGARFSIDARGFGRPRICTSCGTSITVAWGRDPRTRQTVPVAVHGSSRRPDLAHFPFLAVCGCGYSRPLAREEYRAAPTCPGCGKAMAVQKAPDPKELERLKKPVKPSQPVVPLRLRPPARIRVEPGQKTFECYCGERIWIRSGILGQPIQCYVCDRFHIVEVGAPPAPPPTATRPPSRPVRSAPRPKAEPPARPTGTPARALKPGEVPCVCGSVIPPRTSRTGREFACSTCGRKGRVEEAGGALKAVITVEPPPAAAPEPPKDDFLAPPPVRGAPTPEPAVRDPDLAIPSDAEIAICKCGTELFVSSDDVGRAIQCPACAAFMTVEPLPDPSTGGSTLRIRALESMEDWSMDDFK